MAKWLEQASLWYEMYCHDLEVMSSNPSRVEFGVRSTSALSCACTKNVNSADGLVVCWTDQKDVSSNPTQDQTQWYLRYQKI